MQIICILFITLPCREGWGESCPYDEPNAGDDEGDAEELAHIEEHALFEVFLDVLDELDEEAAAEDKGEEGAKEETWTLAGIKALVEPGIDEEDGQIAGGFVQLRGVRGCGEDGFAAGLVGAHVGDESEAPWQGGLVAVDLVIEQIANTDQGCDGGHGDAQSVEHKEGGQFVALGIEQDGEEDAQGAAVTGQAALPGLEDLEGMRQVVRGVIEQAMAQTGADQRADKTIEEKGIDSLWIFAVQAIVFLHEFHTDIKTDDEHQCVPAQCHWPNLNNDGVCCPSNSIEHHK